MACAPDAHIGLLAAGLTMGQLLCMPMIAAGLRVYLVLKAEAAGPC